MNSGGCWYIMYGMCFFLMIIVVGLYFAAFVGLVLGSGVSDLTSCSATLLVVCGVGSQLWLSHYSNGLLESSQF